MIGRIMSSLDPHGAHESASILGRLVAFALAQLARKEADSEGTLPVSSREHCLLKLLVSLRAIKIETDKLEAVIPKKNPRKWMKPTLIPVCKTVWMSGRTNNQNPPIMSPDV